MKTYTVGKHRRIVAIKYPCKQRLDGLVEDHALRGFLVEHPVKHVSKYQLFRLRL